jgi:uncharacterized protein YndB with AHSA1/START domain
VEEQSVIHCTFVIERSYPATPERVFGAFSDPAKKRRWFAEGEGFEVEHFEMDFRVGGKECARFRISEATPLTGTACTNDTTYQDIVPRRRVVFAYTMTLGDKRISASLVTIEFLSADEGINLVFTEQGAFFEGADGPATREEGWRKLLERLSDEFPR